MKPIVTPHELYQDFVIEQLQYHYSGGVLTLVHKDWPFITKLWITDLTGIATMLQDFYSARGPVPRDPSAMFRSYLLFLLTNPEIGITAWVDELYRVPLYAGSFIPILPVSISGGFCKIWLARGYGSILVYFRKHQGVRNNGSSFTNDVPPPSEPINKRRLITSWNPVGIVLPRCGTYAFMAS